MIVNSGLWVPSCLLCDTMEEFKPEDQLRHILSSIDWSYSRKDWSRRGRPGRNISETYSHIFLALTKLLRVAKVVLKCYQNYPKLYKRLGPTSKNGGLENFSLKVQSMKFLLEDLLTSHLRLSLPRTFPSEIVKLILDFSVTGKRKLDVGFYSRRQLDQICEGIQRRKFLNLVNTLTISLFNAVLCNKMDLGGFSLEAQMDCFSKDVKAFHELSNEDVTTKDFSKFSKLGLPQSRRRRSSVHQYLGLGRTTRRVSRRPNILTHDYSAHLL